MYSIAIAEAPASDEIWWAFAALRLLDDAADVLAGAQAACRELAAQSAWHNRGTSARTMRQGIEQLHGSVMGELAAARNARSQVQAGIGT
ncbi:hypothetical protein [Microbacterium sp. NPDC058345]|uniref:hypothetical protein n=1 Tax=Microbacterium sp. NPDC058345 TaxID=3346455 RepID=UPI00366206B5